MGINPQPTTRNNEIIPGMDEQIDSTLKLVETTPKGKLVSKAPFKFFESLRNSIKYVNDMGLFYPPFFKLGMTAPKYFAVGNRHLREAQFLASNPKTLYKSNLPFAKYIEARRLGEAAEKAAKQVVTKTASVDKVAVLLGRYRDAYAGAHVQHFNEYIEAFNKQDDKMTGYMNQFSKTAVLSYGSDETSAVGSQLTEFEINNNAFRKTKNMTGLPKGTDWGYRHSKSAMIKKAVQTLTLESENPKFMEREYQQRSQNSRWLREVNRNSDSIRAPF